jgi:UTP--glucose-1-phosphate uridylyltransferase
MKIRKAVIPAAGLGTRFMPATKTVPKEMFPIVDKPILLYNIEEIIAAGIEEVVLVLGSTKAAIEQFFKDFTPIKVSIARQEKALGLGHAVLCAAEAVGNEPFAVLLGDEIMLPRPGRPSGIAQLCRVYEETKTSAVAVMEVPEADVVKYGIVKVQEKGANLWSVLDVVEKPSVAEAPSRLALPGRYVFDAEIFNHLKNTKPGRNGEIQLTDGMTALAKSKGMLALKLDAERFDAGDKLGFMQVNLEIGLRHPEIGPKLEEYLIKRFGGKK